MSRCDETWTLCFDEWVRERERLREALCTLGNGHFATRGAAEESTAGRWHYPGTYLAGGYDRIAAEIRGEVLVNENLVNWPDWLLLAFRPECGEWLDLDVFDVLSFHQRLDMKRGLLHRRVVVRDREGRVTRLVARRFVSMADAHVAAIHWALTPENWEGRFELRSGLDGGVVNAGVARYRELGGHHLVPEGTGPVGDDGVWLAVRTRQSFLRLAQAARTRVDRGPLSRRTDDYGDRIEQVLVLEAERGRTLAVEKVVALYTSRDWAMAEPAVAAREALADLPGFDTLRARHERRWAELWRQFDLELETADVDAERFLRLHIFHLLQVASPHVVDRDVGVPARGLHGEAYRGHVFWDELFIFPFLNYRMPELTRELLMYRWRRLPAARRIARADGFEGAAYPWQSGSDGREESQVLHLNPRSGRWLPDETHLQRHIGAAIAYNVWQYFETTEDFEFLRAFGAEMLLEVARFWASTVTWDASLERYRIRGVVGPDEYHTRYPGAASPGLDDNAYTNVMAVWCLRCAERALCELGGDRRGELLDELGLGREDRERWRHIVAHMHVPFHDGHILSQFAGYADLEELDWEGLRRRYGDIQRLDRILEAEGDTTDRYKASKQADVLMLFYLFSADELVELFAAMNVPFDRAWIPENIEYYVRRTSHGSTLSRVVHSWVVARSDRRRSWSLLCEALRSDVADIQGGTTAEGIHLGAMAGTVDLVQRGYTGAVIREGVLWLDPSLPDELASLCLRLRVRSGWIDLRVERDRLEVAYASGRTGCVRVGIGGEVHEVALGKRRTFAAPAR